ncbi:hypothetical protein KM043_016136 [Ampulex compressa]|nr:hypothetical protein KM043_016136 [Ampulex compressa]
MERIVNEEKKNIRHRAGLEDSLLCRGAWVFTAGRVSAGGAKRVDFPGTPETSDPLGLYKKLLPDRRSEDYTVPRKKRGVSAGKEIEWALGKDW